MPYRRRYNSVSRPFRRRRRSGYGRARKFKRRMRRRSMVSKLPNLSITPLRQVFKSITRQVVEVTDANSAFHIWPCNGRVGANPGQSQGHLGLYVPPSINARYRNCTVLWSKMSCRLTYWGYDQLTTSPNDEFYNRGAGYITTMLHGSALQGSVTPEILMNDRFARRYLTGGMSRPIRLKFPKYTPQRIVPMKNMMAASDFILDLGETAGQPDRPTRECNWLLWIDTQSQTGTTAKYLIKADVSITYVCMAHNPR